ncbi:MAG TPA: glycosyltransferase [Rubrobacteraceae bacterium]|nr:glycosyltransferase [Rubrobacteraceae bacterium]
MRVAFVTVGDTNRSTGGYLYHARVFAELRKRGVEIREIVPCGASPAEQREATSRTGLDIDSGYFDVIVVDALARIVCAPHLDRWREGCPVVAMVHELPSVAGSGEASEREHEEPLLRSECLISVSEHGKSTLQARGVPPERIRVIPPGFDRLPSGSVARRYERGGAVVRALCVAQWIPRKGILDLVRAWTLRERRGAALLLVGETDADPDYAEAVYAAIAEAPGASVTVAGSVDDEMLADAYAGADLFALPSRYEGYGIVYAEALAHGLPVIACDVGPVPALVGEEAALLVPTGDVGALCGALDLLVRDADLRDRMSAAARSRARELPRWEDTIIGFLGVLREVVGERSRRGRVWNPVGEGRALREQNRLSWNAVAEAHDSHRGDLAGYLRGGGSTLFPEERALLGDLRGSTLAHLQCNSGGDSLSLASLGATVTGVDASDEAIRSARRLSAEAGIAADFVRADVYDWLAATARTGRRFDVVFSSYGVVCWLTDLGGWARGIASVLGPGGRFVLVDFHPAAEIFDEEWRVAYDYPSGGETRLLEEGVGDYVGESGGGLTPAGFAEGVVGFQNPRRCHLFRWGLGEVVTAVAGAGLKVTALEEYPYSNGERHFVGMLELRGRRMVPPESVPSVPLMYGVSAEKRA